MDDLLKYAEIIVKIGAALSLLGGFGLWLYSLNRSVNQILEEVKPNGGKSLKDRVTAIQIQVNKDSNSINTICCRQKWILDNRPEPIFEYNTDGNCTWVNEKYCQLLQHDVNYFLNNGWKNGIHTEDRVRIENEWEKAIKDRRSCTLEYRVVARSGDIIPVRVVAIRNDEYGYIGHIDIISQQKE